VVLNLSGIVAQDALDTKVTTPDGAFELVIDMRIDAQSPATLGMEGRAIQLDVAPTNWVIEAFFHNQPRQGYVNVLGPAMSHVIQKICAKRNLAGVHHLETECNNLVTYIERNEQQFFQVAMSEDQSLAQKSASVHGSVEQRLAGIQQQYNQLRDFLASSELQDVLQLEQEVILKEALRDIYDEEDFARYESTINVFQHILNLKVAHVTCQPIEGDQSPISRYRAALDRAIVSANGYLTRSGQVVELLTRLRAVYSRAEMEALLEAFRRGSRSYEQLMDELRRRMEHPHEDRQDEHHEDGHHEDEHHEDEHHEDEV
jgi:hypothetical protein